MTRTRKKVKLLRDTLEALELTQTELAAELDVSQSRISEYLSGTRPIRKAFEMALECLLRQRGEWPLEVTAKTRV